MRLKRGGPSLLCGEYVVPRSLFGPCWKKITERMPRDIVGLEAFADNQNQMSTLVYVLDSSEDFLSLFRMGKAMIPLHVARRFGGYVYASGSTASHVPFSVWDAGSISRSARRRSTRRIFSIPANAAA